MGQRYFLPDKYELGQEEAVVFDQEIIHHLSKVLRINVDEEVSLVFADEKSFLAKIKTITAQKIIFELLKAEEQVKELPIKVTIASAFPKGDKLEFITQKSTELGADQIIAFPAEFSNVKWEQKKRSKKQERLTKIAQSAAEQSGRTHLPKVELLANIAELISKFPDYDLVIVADEEEAKHGETSKLSQILTNLGNSTKILAIFGSEGGLSRDEVSMFTDNSAIAVGLGNRILRCETAPLFLLSATCYEVELKSKIFLK